MKSPNGEGLTFELWQLWLGRHCTFVSGGEAQAEATHHPTITAAEVTATRTTPARRVAEIASRSGAAEGEGKDIMLSIA